MSAFLNAALTPFAHSHVLAAAAGIALRGAFLLAAIALLDLALRRRPPALRHLVWTAGLAGLLALPLPAVFGPALPVPVPAIHLPAVTPPPPPEASGLRVARRVPDGTVLDATSPAPARSTPAVEPSASAQALPELPAAALIALWLAGVVAVGTRFAAAHLRARRLARGAASAPETFRPFSEAARAARIALGPATSMPMTCGVLRPTVLLPRNAGGWPRDRLERVLLHELAHVRRRDPATALLAQVACVLHWFNPLVWWGAARMREERELACDAAVLVAGARPSSYADDLLAVARSYRAERGAALALAPRSRLEHRLNAVLSGRAAAGSGRRSAWVWPVAAAAAIAAASVQPAARAAVAPEPAATTNVTAETGSATAVTGESGTVVATGASGAGSVRVDADGDGVSYSYTTGDDATGGDGGFASGFAFGFGDRLKGRHLHVHTGDHGDFNAEVIEDGRELTISGRGRITFDPGERDVVALSDGGRLRVSENDGETRRRIEITSSGGGMSRRYWVNGKEHDYDDDARAWLARVIPETLRATGLDAEAREHRIYGTGGADAVLKEISRIGSDYAARLYFQALLAEPDLGAGRVARVLEQAGEQIESDYDLAEVLTEAGGRPLDDRAQLALAHAAAAIGSDYDRRRSLTALLDCDALSPDAFAEALRAAQQIGSDYDLAEVLVELAGKRPVRGGTAAPFLEAARGIGSDYDLRRALTAAVRSGMDPAGLVGLLDLARDRIGSDHDLSALLVAVAESGELDAAGRDAYRRAVDSIGSEYDARRAREALGEN